MKVVLQNGMRFQHNPLEDGNEFRVEKYDFYGDNKPIWCAVAETPKYPRVSILPLSEICLENYMPMVDGKWVNEPVEYEF